MAFLLVVLPLLHTHPTLFTLLRFRQMNIYWQRMSCKTRYYCNRMNWKSALFSYSHFSLLTLKTESFNNFISVWVAWIDNCSFSNIHFFKWMHALHSFSVSHSAVLCFALFCSVRCMDPFDVFLYNIFTPTTNKREKNCVYICIHGGYYIKLDFYFVETTPFVRGQQQW